MTAANKRMNETARPIAPFLMICLGLGLNQTSVLFGFNLSIADAVAVLLFATALLSQRLFVPTWPLIFFLVLLSQVILVGGFITPAVFGVTFSINGILGDVVKLITAFLYFLLGIYVVRVRSEVYLLRAFMITATIMGILAISQLIIPVLPRIDMLFFGELRFRGLMNDPNYFAVIQLVALALLFHDTKISKKIRIPSLVILGLSALLSGSKTGAITLFAFLLYRLAASLVRPFNRSNGIRTTLRVMSVPLLVGCLVLVFAEPEWRYQLAAGMSEVPGLNRVSTLLVDFESSVSTGGSSRDTTWRTAIAIIEASPIWGVGVGTYMSVGTELTGYRVLAHNTFLQVAAEWGLPLAGLFFIGVFILTLKRPSTNDRGQLWGASRDAILVLLVGSMGISLNNARVFWLLLGILLAIHLWSYGKEYSTRAPDNCGALKGREITDATSKRFLQ